MCGIAGIITTTNNSLEFGSAIQKMTDAIAHRGPNSQGLWNDAHCYFGHRRLSIIDLSEAGNQPFISQDGRYVLIYNGELYNYKDLKFELQRVEHGSNNLPYFFKTNSDTEVILASYLRWGNKCVQKFNGMFAFAIWDSIQQKVFISRDRLGVKPLYYQYKNNTLVFASEIRALLKSGVVEKKINLQAVNEYLQYATVHAPNTIIEDVQMLLPAHSIEFSIQHSAINITEWWNASDYTKSTSDISYEETCKLVNEKLTMAVERQLVADVPFGAFLSGGIDSSAIVGLMSKVSTKKVQTFNVSFDESEFSEAKYAKQIASKFNTEHHEIKLTPTDFLNQLSDALKAMDHPSGDGPNSYIVSNATKNAGITMALSGLGGDELFAGYDVFKRMLELDKKSWLNIVPAKGLIGKLVSMKNKSVQGDKMSEILHLDNVSSFHAYPINRKLFNQNTFQALIKQKANDDAFIKDCIKTFKTDNEHQLSKISLYEMNTYMQNVLLRDADQMSMAVALEVRVPFLDYQLVETVLGIKDEYKYPHTPKKLLTDSLGDLLPMDIINRPKMGFTLPWKDWLKVELREFSEDHIIEFSKREFVNRDAVLVIWNRFLNNDPKITWSRVWHLIVLNHWIKTNIEN